MSGVGTTPFGSGIFGGDANGSGPAVGAASPLNGATIDVTATRLRVRLTTDPVEVGIDITTLRINILGEIFDGTTWAAAYSTSYIQTHDDGTYTVVIIRNSPWLPGTRYYVLFYIADNNGVGD